MGADHEHVRDEMRALLHTHGLRATSARVAALVALHERAAPMTHEQLMEALPESVHDRAAVWRILADLAELGILRRMDLGDRVWRYELHDACRPVAADHPHFLCETCGDVRCLPPVQLRTVEGELPAALVGASFLVRVTGTCAQCQQA